VNIELAAKALELAKANPERFDMHTFSQGWGGRGPLVKDGPDFMPPCGTTACYAGWVSYVAAPAGSEIQGAYVEGPDGLFQHVEDYAIKALGITEDQANVLFYLKDIEEVEAAVGYLADNPDVDRDGLLCAVRP
jgi:hypothetical protein